MDRPLSRNDFVWWSGSENSDARAEKWEMVRSQFVQETIDNVNYLMMETVERQDKSPTAYLLPVFDEYLIGYKDRTASLPDKYAQKVVPGGNGMFLPIIVVDGQVMGTWKRVPKADRIDIELTPFEKFSKIENEAIEVAAERYGRFMEMPVLLKRN